MHVSIPLETMTTLDKLKALEYIWSDLQRTPDVVPAPAWHADVLHARENRVREGSSQLGDWEDANRRIRKQIL